MKVLLTLSRFGLTFGTLRFDEEYSFNSILGFRPTWDYKTTNAVHAESPGVNTSAKI